jgi:hypothetical protein
MFLLQRSLRYKSIVGLLLLGSGQMAMAAAPNPLNAYSVYKGMTLKWAAIANPKSYTVCYATAAFTGTCPNAIAVAASVTQRSIGNLVNGTAYYFQVKATNTSNVTVVSNQVVSIPRAGKLNDTGITTCSNNTQNGLPCPVVGFPGQDAQYGRDKVFSWNGDGHAGFSFIKISATGKPLAESATSWNCVRDNVTGLMWENKTDDGGLHDKDNTYSWYEPDNTKNGGSAGFQNAGSCVGSACDTYAYVQAVNSASWCGHMDWRLPTLNEFFSIMDYGRSKPAIDTTYFLNAMSWFFWTSSLHANANLSDYAGSVYLWEGNGYGSYKHSSYFVQLVRDGQ